MSIDPKRLYQMKKNMKQAQATALDYQPTPHIDLSETGLSKMLQVTAEDKYIFDESLFQDFTEQTLSTLFADCRQRTLQSIIGPLGLGKFVAIYDRVGGNVDTIHNSRKFVDANGNVYDKKPKNVETKVVGTEKFQEKYENRKKYDSDEYHGDKDYKNANRAKSKAKKEGTLKDAYTGKKINQNEKSHQDHIVSAKELSDDGAVILSGNDPKKLANSESNLVATNAIINTSKGYKTMQEFIEYLNKTREQRQKKIKKLQDKENLTHKEKDELRNLENLESADTGLMEQADKKSRTKINNKVNEYYESKEFKVNTLKTSGKEGVKMGMQQAIGLLIYDVTNSIIDEITDSYHNGFVQGVSDEGFMDALKIRLKNIANKF